MDSLYPSLFSAILLIGWAPGKNDRENEGAFSGVIWFALGYVVLVITKLLFVQVHLHWIFVELGCLWMIWHSVLRLGIRVWPSILTSYILTLVHLQALNWYPFILWKGIPTTYLIGLVWSFLAFSVGPAPEQKYLVLSLSYLLVTKLQTGFVLSPPDNLVMNSFWIGLALVSLFLRIQTTVQSKFSPVKPGM